MIFTPAQKEFITEAHNKFGDVAMRKFELIAIQNEEAQRFLGRNKEVWLSLKPYYLTHSLSELMIEIEIEEKYGKELAGVEEMLKKLHGACEA